MKSGTRKYNLALNSSAVKPIFYSGCEAGGDKTRIASR